MNPLAYQLTEDTYVCLANNRLVFSDLGQDKYRCLNQANTEAALRKFPRFQGQGTASSLGPTPAQKERTQLVMRALTDKGLLADTGELGNTMIPVSIPLPARSIMSHSLTPTPRHHFGHWVLFLHASFKASWKLRLLSLRHITQGVAERKACNKPGSQDRNAVFELVETFYRLRPYYVREYLCRFDSLALIDFLALYGHFPNWVFGVRSGPFLAHCWVQEGDCVLNDSIDSIRQYTPIMAF